MNRDQGIALARLRHSGAHCESAIRLVRGTDLGIKVLPTTPAARVGTLTHAALDAIENAKDAIYALMEAVEKECA